MDYRQLTIAREYRGFTQSKLSGMIEGLSQSNLSKYEKGLGTLSDDLVRKIMEVLDFPIGFMDISVGNDYEKSFRKKARLKAMDKCHIERFVDLLSYSVDYMTSDLEIPDYNFPNIDIESGVTPEEIAMHLRNKFRLGIEPINNIINFLERNGVIVYEWDCEYDDFDGVSLITRGGNHLIVLNKNMSNDRKRRSIAHELGHTIMHNDPDMFIVSSRDKEEEADRFASEFLMPRRGIESSLRGIKFSDLPVLKSYWKVSMMSIVVRARRLNCIDDSRYKYFATEISRRGWRLKEPYDVRLDESVVVSKMYTAMCDGLGYDMKTLSDAMNIPSDVTSCIFQPKRKNRFWISV